MWPPRGDWAQEQPANPAGWRKRIAIAAGALGAVVAIVVGALYSTGVVGNAGSGTATAEEGQNDPTRVVNAYFTALKSGDCAEVFAFIRMPDQMPGTMRPETVEKSFCENLDNLAAPDALPADIRTEVVKQSATTATVKVTGTVKSGSKSLDLRVAKVDGKWKLDLLSVLGPASDPPAKFQGG